MAHICNGWRSISAACRPALWWPPLPPLQGASALKCCCCMFKETCRSLWQRSSTTAAFARRSRACIPFPSPQALDFALFPQAYLKLNKASVKTKMCNSTLLPMCTQHAREGGWAKRTGEAEQVRGARRRAHPAADVLLAQKLRSTHGRWTLHFQEI